MAHKCAKQNCKNTTHGQTWWYDTPKKNTSKNTKQEPNAMTRMKDVWGTIPEPNRNESTSTTNTTTRRKRDPTKPEQQSMSEQKLQFPTPRSQENESTPILSLPWKTYYTNSIAWLPMREKTELVWYTQEPQQKIRHSSIITWHTTQEHNSGHASCATGQNNRKTYKTWPNTYAGTKENNR